VGHVVPCVCSESRPSHERPRAAVAIDDVPMDTLVDSLAPCLRVAEVGKLARVCRGLWFAARSHLEQPARMCQGLRYWRATARATRTAWQTVMMWRGNAARVAEGTYADSMMAELEAMMKEEEEEEREADLTDEEARQNTRKNLSTHRHAASSTSQIPARSSLPTRFSVLAVPWVERCRCCSEHSAQCCPGSPTWLCHAGGCADQLLLCLQVDFLEHHMMKQSWCRLAPLTLLRTSSPPQHGTRALRTRTDACMWQGAARPSLCCRVVDCTLIMAESARSLHRATFTTCELSCIDHGFSGSHGRTRARHDAMNTKRSYIW